ncbi:MAG: LPXTG cell wall anchor domain-containing protein, partial [Eubacterium sp.]|nr:LPXTG cell wall anchor domain-containing protein [Candidatus Colimonas fimequi]
VTVTVDETVVAEGIDADTYTKEFTPENVIVTGAKNYDVTVKVTKPVVEIINKAPLNIEVAGTTKHDTYDGKEHSNTEVTVSQLPEGVSVTTKDTVVAKGIDADTYTYNFTPEEVVVTGADNYDVTVKVTAPVVEIIDKKAVEIFVGGTTKTDTYDGQKHSNTEITVDKAPEGVVVTVDETVVAEGINADTYTKEFTPANVIVTGAENYDVTVTVTKPMVEIINKAPLTITVAGTTKTDVYDGKEHSNTEVTVSQLPEGVSVTTKDTVVAKGIDADTYTYNFTPEEVVVAGADNYDVTVEVTAPVVEIITKKPITVEVNGTTKTAVYDGEAHSNSEVVYGDMPEGVAVTLNEGVKAEGIDADTYTRNLTAEDFTVVSANYDVTLAIGDPIVQTITPQKITVSDSGELPYNGEVQTLTIPAEKANGVVSGETLTLTDAGISGQNAGTYTDVNKYSWSVAKADGSDSTGNYTIEVTGQLVITPLPITITADFASKYEGDADPEFTGSITEGELVDENDLGEIKYYRTNDDEEQGTYVDVITAEYTPNDNYVVTVVPNTFVIEDARERMVEVLVTYKVVNGSWNKGGKQDIVHTYNIKIKDIVKLTPPAVGDRPDAGYKAGSWDAVIPETITGDSTDLVFTYTYVPKKGGGGDGDDNDKDDSPKTGDDTPVGLLAALMLSSAFGLGFSLFRRREQE